MLPRYIKRSSGSLVCYLRLGRGCPVAKGLEWGVFLGILLLNLIYYPKLLKDSLAYKLL